MLIDWFTVGAQVLNFLILVWLMKKFLYQPILGAIDAREKKVAAELADAASKKAEAKKDQDELQKKSAEFDQQRAGLLTKATDEAKVERTRLFDEAKKAADALTQARLESAKKEDLKLQQSILKKTQQEVFLIARKTLADLGGADLETQIVNRFIQELKVQSTQAEFMRLDGSVMIRTSIALADSQRQLLESTIKQIAGADVSLDFSTDSGLIRGIELTCGGHRLAWNIDDHLHALEKGVIEILQGKTT
jgi:F-type H+-transporting ATPase subunit b